MKSLYTLPLCIALLAGPCWADTKTEQVPARSAQYIYEELKEIANKATMLDGMKIVPYENCINSAEKKTANILDGSSLSFSQRVWNAPQTLPLIQRVRYVMSAQSGAPDYASLVRGEKFLFLTENITGSPETFQAVKSALSTLRRSYPDKRILLATEFVQTKRLTSPVLRRSGGPYDLIEKYPIFSFADEQGIDVLALEDHIFAVENGTPLIKVGDEYIQFPPLQETIHDVIDTINGTSSESLTQVLQIESTIKKTTYGIRKLNAQWAKRIQQVQDRYDIIVVYSTIDHLRSPATSVINNLHAQTASVVILALPEDHIDKNLEQETFALSYLLAVLERGNLPALQEEIKNTDNEVKKFLLSRELRQKSEESSKFISEDYERNMFYISDYFRALHASALIYFNAQQPTSPTYSPNIQEIAEAFSHPFYVKLPSSTETQQFLLAEYQQQVQLLMAAEAASQKTEESTGEPLAQQPASENLSGSLTQGETQTDVPSVPQETSTATPSATYNQQPSLAAYGARTQQIEEPNIFIYYIGEIDPSKFDAISLGYGPGEEIY